MLANRVISDLFGPDFVVVSQVPISLGPDSEPEPDIVVVPGPARRYMDHKAEAREVIPLVEMSDSSLAYDRGRKSELYTKHGITDFWILNLVDRTLEIRRDPDPAFGYRTIRIALPQDTVEPLSLPGVTVAVADLLP